jgi:hypothetical protein
MQTLKYKSGMWNVEATLQDVDDNKRLATVFAMAGEGEEAMSSQHTIVFEHASHRDEIEEVKAHILRVLVNSH